MSVNLNLVSYTPTDAAAANEVLKNGNIGNITSRALEGDTLTITTDKGTFTFSAVGLEDPQNVTTDDIAGALSSLNNIINGQQTNAMLADIFAVMQLFHEIGVQQRASGREARMAARDLQLSEIANQVEDLKKAAMVAMAMGILSGALQIAGGAIQLGFAGSAAKGLGDASKASTAAAKTGDAAKISEAASKAAEASKNADILIGKGQGWSGIMGGSGGIMNAIGQGASGHLNAEATKHQGEATKADAAAQTENDFINAMRDLIRDVQEKLQSILASEADTMKSILRA